MHENLFLRGERERGRTTFWKLEVRTGNGDSRAPATIYRPYINTYGRPKLALESGSNSSGGSFLQSSSPENLFHATCCPCAL
jgi:hypothetical protein